MPEKKRLADVIREECVKDGDAARAAFADMAALEKKYPKVASAVGDEAELRPSMGGTRGVLEKIARPFLESELAKSPPPEASAKSAPPTPPDPPAEKRDAEERDAEGK
jgi:hypothetical protein